MLFLLTVGLGLSCGWGWVGAAVGWYVPAQDRCFETSAETGSVSDLILVSGLVLSVCIGLWCF